MDAILENQYIVYGITGAVITATTVFVVKNIGSFLQELFKQTPKVKCPPGSVLLVQVPRGLYAPSFSPFPLKLETYLRMTDIPYVTDVTGIMSEKGKTPWIMYNGETVADSQFSIEFLNKKFSKDLNKHLSKQDRATAEALRIMIDEHLYWCLLYFRWVEDQEQIILKDAFKSIPLSNLFLRFFSGKMKKLAYAQGMGRHSPEEVLHIMKSDLQVLSDFLGDKPFLMGDIPCEVDCSALGLLAQLLWQDSNKRTKDVLKDEYPSLVKYCERLKEKFWPDWDECTVLGGTKQTTQ